MVDSIIAAPDAEAAVLGSVLMVPESIESIHDKLPSEDAFTRFEYRPVWRQMLRLAADSRPPDFVTVQDALTSAEGMDAVDATMLLSELITAVSSGSASPHYGWSYANDVRRAYQVRMWQESMVTGLSALMQDDDLSPVDAAADLLSALEAHQGDKSDPGPRSAAELVPSVLDVIVDRRAGILQPDETPTPWRSLNKPLGGGLKPGSTCVVAARPSMGKTLFAGALLAEAAEHGQAVMFSAEMSYDSVLERLLSAFTAVPYEHIHKGLPLSDDEFQEVMGAAEYLATLPLFVDDRPAITTAQIRARIQRLLANGPVSLVIFDYLELAGDDPNAKNVEQRLSKIITELSVIGKRLHVPMCVLAQLSREVERRNPPIPKLADLRYSGAIEQVADQVLMLYRPEYYVEQGALDPDPSYANRCEVYIHKNRNGTKEMVPLHFDGPTFRLTDMLGAFA